MEHLNQNAYKFNEASCSKLQEGCEVLRPFNISSFRYFRVFEDGHYLNLSTNNTWLQERLSIPDNGRSMAEAMRKSTIDKPYHYLWPTESDDPILKHMQTHKICNGFSLYKRLPDHSVEAWSFGSNPEDFEMQNFYMNNLNLIQDFISYFTAKFNRIIEPCASKLARFGHEVCTCPLEFCPSNLTNISSSEKRYSAHFGGIEGYLTSREFECLKLTSRGRTCKEAALELGISNRTVECYLLNAKKKFSINRKSELIDLYHTNFLG